VDDPSRTRIGQSLEETRLRPIYTGPDDMFPFFFFDMLAKEFYFITFNTGAPLELRLLYNSIKIAPSRPVQQLNHASPAVRSTQHVA
jgi:hypothetical protein